MEARRSTLGVAVLNDCIYAVGGFDGSTGLNSAEVLDLSVASPMMVMPIFQLVRKLGEGLSSLLLFFLFFCGGFLCQEFLRGHNKVIANSGHKLYQIKGGRFDRLIALPIT